MDRRQFLRSSAAAGLALTAISRGAYAGGRVAAFVPASVLLTLFAVVMIVPVMVVFVMFAMVGSCVISGIAGALIPLGLQRVGADPATASSIFLTTATDVVSMGMLLTLATLLLL